MHNDEFDSENMDKVVYVPRRYQRKGHYIYEQEPTGEVRKGLFGGDRYVYKTVKKWVWDDEYSNKLAPLDEFFKEIEEKTKELNNNNYAINSVVPITVGHGEYEYKTGAGYNSAWGYGWGFGYGYTSGVMIFAKKIK